jgi:hypothetical protein
MAAVNGTLRGQIEQALAVLAALTGLTALTACGSAASGHAGMPSMGQQHGAEANPDLDPGTSLHGANAPDIRIVLRQDRLEP